MSNKVSFSSVPQMKAYVAGHGMPYYFSPDTMSFFSSRIESGIIAEHYFITSEQCDGPARYTVRYFTQGAPHESVQAETLGEFQEHETLQNARQALRDHLSS